MNNQMDMLDDLQDVMNLYEDKLTNEIMCEILIMCAFEIIVIKHTTAKEIFESFKQISQSAIDRLQI